jgi:predicted nucleotidyltransferase
MRRDIGGTILWGDNCAGSPAPGAARSSAATNGSDLSRRRGFRAMFCRMNRSEALETLRRSERDLRARGVRRAAVFGSVARGDSRPDSDIDIMVEIDPDAHLTVFDYVGLKDYIASLFDGPVDVVNRDGLKPYVRPAATADAIYAF